MNYVSNLNAKLIRQVVYVPTPGSTSLLLTVKNCAVNAFIERIIITLNSTDATFSNQVNLFLLDRGNGFNGAINGITSMTFLGIGASSVPHPASSMYQSSVQNGNTIIYEINQSVQDSEGLGNIYVRLNRFVGTFNVGFTMAVILRPEVTYNTRLNTRNQNSSHKNFRVISENANGIFENQTNSVSQSFLSRSNIDVLSNGFTRTGTGQTFYFGTPARTRRWYIGFDSDVNPTLGGLARTSSATMSFSYWNGTTWAGFANTQVFNGCLGSSIGFVNDGVIIFENVQAWLSTTIPNDPLTKYNSVLIGLGQTLATNNLVPNPPMFWVRCLLGVTSAADLAGMSYKISTVVPLIDPDQALNVRRELIAKGEEEDPPLPG